MVSGKYSALAGAISREQAIANISANLANVNTTGYKKSMVNFESILRGEQQIKDAKGINYNRIKGNFTDFTAGAMRSTENPLDMAIHGDAFFKVKGPNGTLYTKRGDFALDGNGVLTTSNGLPVLDDADAEITIPDTESSDIAVGDEGMIYILGPQGSREEVAQLAIVAITDKLKLKKEPDTTYSLSDPAAETEAENIRVLQGNLELSNVNMAEEMTKMINSNRTFEIYHKVIKSYSTISEQQSELGTLG